jgi:DNA modification methylase
MKPVWLFTYQIQNSSKQNQIVLDPFWWSWTTIVSCHQINRYARLVELDPKYVQTIVNRMIKLDPELEVKRNWEDYILKVI